MKILNSTAFIAFLLVTSIPTQARASTRLSDSTSSSILIGEALKLASALGLWAFWEGVQAPSLTVYQCSSLESAFCCNYPTPATNSTIATLDLASCVPTLDRQKSCAASSHMFCRKAGSGFSHSEFTETSGRTAMIAIMTGLASVVGGTAIINYGNSNGLQKLGAMARIVRDASASTPGIAAVAASAMNEAQKTGI